MIGQRFGSITVISEVDPIYSGSRPYRAVLCECDCGARNIVRVSDLKMGRTNGCKKWPPYRERLGNDWIVKTHNGIEILLDDTGMNILGNATITVSNTGYPLFWIPRIGRRMLPRAIMNCPPGMQVDHINRDPLDNRKQNLRVVTPSENSQNTARRRTGTSRFKGVCFDRARHAWVAVVMAHGETKHLGRFESEVEAARAYDRAAISAHGEFACTNEHLGLIERSEP